MNDQIGIAKRDIKEGDVIATITICGPVNPQVRSDNIRFLPYGKKKLLKKVTKS